MKRILKIVFRFMKGGNDLISRWFQEYKNFDEDMKEEYIHCYLSEERKYLVLDYEKFKEAVKAVSLSAGELKKIYPDEENIADKVVQMFSYQGMAFAPDLLRAKCIDSDMYNLVLNINRQLKMIINAHSEDCWTVAAMDTDERWLKAREFAKGLYLKL